MSSIPTNHNVITIERHILNAQEEFPDASGALTQLLYDILDAPACRINTEPSILMRDSTVLHEKPKHGREI